ncbi:glycosyltransferase family 4 protein [Alcanivorax sp. 1008]|uniref:glycosyltransferase family 4 protein n=1 Tax=Alcanivorax sp. 1008 TaxID=2816853 RepID=UPI001D1E5437|nr:glycosyltransferase family 4 protein [Alcanivorax sp. 1008]MCC1498217.1 glycosyltransferase family 4 protein [Alcanivorax sp. 1008]
MPINNIKQKRASGKILHIASWYPNPWDGVEGNFVRDQIRVFKKELDAETIVVQVRPSPNRWPRFQVISLDEGARGYFMLAAVKPGKAMEWLSTAFLFFVLLKERAWRFNCFHFHIAYPLLLHSNLWRWIFRKPILISEHWSAYHYNFYLPENSKDIDILRRPFQNGYPVIAVSQALANDIFSFSKRHDFSGFVIPNFVPLHGARADKNTIPVFFSVNTWRSIKNPMPMLQGLNRALVDGHHFKLVIGGAGDMIDKMRSFVGGTALEKCTIFLGKMTKNEIADQLTKSNGYLFSSDYETFSVACAEALGAGVPLIGPYIPAIAEYASDQEWVKVDSSDSDGWSAAISRFLRQWQLGCWDSAIIAERAASRFSEDALRASYISVMQAIWRDLA